MDETLGKRITQHRKRLGMTQDKLAEQLGVTAQAVSKWENDQSCPDITMLPKLAEIFGISIDALLGVAPQAQAKEAEVVDSIPVEEAEEAESDGLHFQKDNWEFQWDGGKKSHVRLAIWVLLIGGLLLANEILRQDLSFWEASWSSGLILFGLSNLLHGFSIFKLVCIYFGADTILSELGLISVSFRKELLLPALLLLFGLSLLVDAMRKPKGHRFSFIHNGQNIRKSRCDVNSDHFVCDMSFGEACHVIDTPQLRRGEVNVSFGDLKIDLSGCEEIAPGCIIEANCSFGDLTFKVPRCYRVEAAASTAFGNFEVKGSPDPSPAAVITLDANVSFGEICVHYI